MNYKTMKKRKEKEEDKEDKMREKIAVKKKEKSHSCYSMCKTNGYIYPMFIPLRKINFLGKC